MANANTLADINPARLAIVGYPGSGKTGAIAALANAGLKVRVIAFDKSGNMQALVQYTKPEFRKNIDIVLLEDKMKMGAKNIEVDGAPDAFVRGVRLMTNWKDKDEKGVEYNLGQSNDWGLDTVVVLDSLTSMGDAAKRRAKFLLNSTNLNDDRVYGAAMGEQEHFIELLMKSEAKHHTIVLSHLRIIGPKDTRKGDSQIMEQIKEQTAELVPVRLFPSALGWQLPQQIGRHFPAILLAESKVQNGKVKRVLSTVTDLGLDLKFPALNIPTEMVIHDASGKAGDGLLKAFDAVSPGWRAAVQSASQSTN